MDEALTLAGGNNPRVTVAPYALGAAALVCLAAASWPHASTAYFIFSLFALGAVTLVFLPIPIAINFFFGYLFLDGAIKIFANYHPLFHVAQDLVVLALCVRSVMDRMNGGVEKFFHTPFASLIVLFALWVAIQYINPFGLGALPSVAGTKVYFSGILLFLVAFHHLRRQDSEQLLTWLVTLGFLEGALATIEYIFFQGFVFHLHPKYAEIAGQNFVGDLFRPFGTTSAPGAPSMWIFLTAGPAVYLLINARSLWKKILASAHLVFAVPTLIFCQTRSALLLSLLGASLAAVAPGRGFSRRAVIALIFAAMVVGGAWFTTSGLSLLRSDRDGGLSNQQVNLLEKRIATLRDGKTFTSSRTGAWDGAAQLAQFTIFGIGLSRVGAASAVWTDRIERDPYFDKKWSFADNLYRAIFTELGLFGLLGWLALILFPSLALARNSLAGGGPLPWLCGTYPLLILVGGLGSEGVLYNPMSGFLWIMLAIGLREVQDERLE